MCLHNKLLLFCLFILLAGCATPPTSNRETVAKDIAQHSGYTLLQHTAPGQIDLPIDLVMQKGITEDAAITVALWNNTTFQSQLYDLDIARGDLQQAGLLPNPEAVYFFPVTAKPYKYLVDFPLETLWLRPLRIQLAQKNADVIASTLSQAGLNLIRDVRIAYADLLRIKEQGVVVRRTLDLRNHIAQLTQKRLSSGDVPVADNNLAKLAALQVTQNASRVAYDIQLSEERLRLLMGIGSVREKFTLKPTPFPSCHTLNTDGLIAQAFQNRPDAKAAVASIAASDAQMNVSKIGWWRLLGIGDATSGTTGHALSPGARATIPIFNYNQGNINRSSAEKERALYRQQAVLQQIILDVYTAYAQYQQACKELLIVQQKVKPVAEKNVQLVEKAFSNGEIPYLLVLNATSIIIDTQFREAQLRFEVRRAAAELERSVAKRRLTQIH